MLKNNFHGVSGFCNFKEKDLKNFPYLVDVF